MATIITRAGKGSPLTNAELDSNFTNLNNGKLETTATTSDVAEGTRLYYTDARARAAVSATGSLSYNSSTGVFSFTQGNTDTVAEGSTNLYYTNARARAALSAGSGISYNSTTGAIASTITQYTDANARASLGITAGSAAYNSSTGVFTLPTTTAHITEGTNLYYTDARVRLALSAGSGISYNNTTGVISSSITQYTDASARAALSFTAGSGAYNASTGVITIPTNTSQLTNGAGFITGSSLSPYALLSGATFTGNVASTYFTATGAGAGVQLTDRSNSANNWIMYSASNIWRVYSSTAVADRLSVDASGNLTASGNVTAYSDERLKKDWSDLSCDFINDLANLKHGKYTRTDIHERQVGVSAQSLREILPEAVMESEDGMLSVAYGNAALVAAVQLAKEVVALRAEIAELKGK